MPKPAALPVIIRVHPKNLKPADVMMSNIEAFFPTEPGTDSPHTMECYCSLGQHSSCSAGYIGAKTRPANKDEVARMLKHLKQIGYENLKVVSRASASHYKARKKALDAIQ